MRLIIRAVIACICAVLVNLPGVSAAAYPERVITMIIAYVPGGGTDVLGNVVDDPASFAVHADSGFKDLLQLAAYAKANPGAISVGTPGVGAPGHLAILMFAKLAGTNVNHVPFKGAGDVRAALAGRQIIVGAISVGESFQ